MGDDATGDTQVFAFQRIDFTYCGGFYQFLPSQGKLYPTLVWTNGIVALTQCQVVNPDSVCSLAGEAQGKQDDHPVRLVLHIDEEYPLFCPVVCHLLWYLKVFDIKSGYLFLALDVLIAVHQSRSVLSASTYVTHDSFRSTTKT